MNEAFEIVRVDDGGGTVVAGGGARDGDASTTRRAIRAFGARAENIAREFDPRPRGFILRRDAKAFLRASLVVLRLAEIDGGLGDGVGEGFAVGADGGIRRVGGIGGELVFLRDDGAEDAVGERLELLAGLRAGVRAAEVVRGGGAADGAARAEHATATRHAGLRVAVPPVARLAGERVEVVRRRFLQGLLAPETTGEGALRGRRGKGKGGGSEGWASRADRVGTRNHNG